MIDLEQFTEALAAGGNLNAEQASAAAQLLAQADVDDGAKKDFLLALARKGETVEEVAAFADTFRGYAVDPRVEDWADRAIDVCGTGGDGSGTFNISTAVSFLLAAAEVPVFKHGNRSITSKCGSADLLEAVGIRLDAPHDVLRASLEELNFCFFFAPAFHPAFKSIMPVRKALAAEGRRTVFNILGPLINPGRPAHQLLGVFSAQWVAPLAETLERLGLTAGCVVHGRPTAEQGLDELSCAGDNEVAGLGRLRAFRGTVDAGAAGLPSCDFRALRGGDVETNVGILHALFDGGVDGKVPEGLRDSVLFNAGVALWISGRSEDLQAGVSLARETIASGRARGWLERARAFYAKG